MNDRSVAIVTAASSGIGRSCARKLDACGYQLFLLSRSDSVSNLAIELGGVGVQGSVTVEDDLRRVVDIAVKSFGRVDAVFNGTGHARSSIDPTGRRFDPGVESHLLDIPDENWYLAFDLYFLNVVRMARLVTPHMIQRGSGAIVNISASSAFEPSSPAVLAPP